MHHLSDEVLLKETEQLVQKEREILSVILRHLREIERRRLFSSLGYSSLFAYVSQKLGYPEDQACRRIDAMRLLKEFPEMEKKVEQGALSLTSLSLAKAAFGRNNCSREKKLEILRNMESKSTRQVEKILAEFAPIVGKPDRIYATSEEKIEITFTANACLQEKLETVRGLLTHKHSHLSLGELMEKICDIAIATLDKSSAAPRVKTRAIWKKAQSKCEQCGSKHALEIDHKIPKGRSGSNAIENLRLLCRSCNQRAAIEAYGIEKIEPYLRI